MNKRGLSDIITTVLIILISLAAIVLIWAFIRGFLMKSGTQINVNSFSESFDVPLSSVNMGNESISFSVKRTAGTEIITGIVINLEDSGGKVVPIVKNDSYDVLQSRGYSFNYTELGLKDISYLSIAPVYSGKTGNIVKRVKVGEISTNKGGAGSGASQVVCGNNIIDSNEQCDGTNLNGNTCESLGFDGGTLSCNSTCGLNKDMCMVIPREGLLLWYKFDNNSAIGESDSIVKDLSGNGKHSGLVNGPEIVPGRNGGYARKFERNYNDDYQDLIYLPEFLPNLNPTGLTLAVWVKNPRGGAVLSHIKDSGEFYLWASNNLQKFIYTDSTGQFYDISSTALLSDNQWYLIVATWEKGESAKLYLNKELKMSAAVPDLGFKPYGCAAVIGLRDCFGRGDHFNGTIDDLMIWDRSLSQEEISRLY